MLRLLLVLSLVSGAGADPMIGEILHLLRSLEKRAAVTTVTDSIAHRLANPATVINSVQRGSVSVPNESSTTSTITSVNTAKAFCIPTGSRGGNSGSHWATELTNATTVTLWQGNAGGTSSTCGFEVVELK